MDVQRGDVHKWLVTVWASKLVFDFFWLSCYMKNKKCLHKIFMLPLIFIWSECENQIFNYEPTWNHFLAFFSYRQFLSLDIQVSFSFLITHEHRYFLMFSSDVG